MEQADSDNSGIFPSPPNMELWERIHEKFKLLREGKKHHALWVKNSQLLA